MKLSKEQYNSGDTFENPYPHGPRVYVLRIYPDLKHDNNWVAVLNGEGEDIDDTIHIIINQDAMKERLPTSTNGMPFIYRGEIKRLILTVLRNDGNNNEVITFS